VLHDALPINLLSVVDV